MSVLAWGILCCVLMVYWSLRGLDFAPLKLVWWVVGSTLLFVCSIALFVEHHPDIGNVALLVSLAYIFGVPAWWLLHPRRERLP